MTFDPLVPRPRALLLDMDGTITEPLLDFPRIKAEMGINGQPILEALARMTPDERTRAEAILHRHESEAAERSTLNPGCKELLAWVAACDVATALITRNTRLSVQTVLARHGLSFGALVTREDAPAKPDPAPLYLACERLGVRITDVWMVGDGQYDVEAGLAAGVPTVWLSHGRPKPFIAEPWRQVRDLHELTALLDACTVDAAASAN